eukprot:scaffold14.g1268.t1
MACPGIAARAPRAALAVLLAACLLAGALAQPAASPSFTNVVAGTSTDSLTGSVYDVDCPCGFVTDFEVFTNPDTQAIADIRIKCSGDASAYVSGPGPVLADGASANYVADGSSADGFTKVGVASVAHAVANFDPSGSDLDCGSGYIVGVQMEAYVDATRSNTQELINIKASCAAKDDVKCTDNQPVDCQPGYVRDANSQQCEPCPAGTKEVNGECQYWKATPCPKGSFQDKTGKATCAKCPVDTYQALTGKTTCSACCKDGTELGKTCFLWTRGKTGAAKKATPCPKGSFQDKIGKATCAKCPVDTYQALTGKTTCSACCKDGTELGKTCFLWTRGKTGAAKCDATRVRPGKLL